jgi:hypothetical protein
LFEHTSDGLIDEAFVVIRVDQNTDGWFRH